MRASDEEVRTNVKRMVDEAEAKWRNLLFLNKNRISPVCAAIKENEALVKILIAAIKPSLNVNDVLVFGGWGNFPPSGLGLLPYGGLLITRKKLYWKTLLPMSADWVRLEDICEFKYDNFTNFCTMDFSLKSGGLMGSQKSFGRGVPHNFESVLNEVLKYLQENQ